MVSPFPILFFSSDLRVLYDEGLLVVDGWLHFAAPGRIAVLVNELKKSLDVLLERKLEDPRRDITANPISEAIIRLFDTEGYS